MRALKLKEAAAAIVDARWVKKGSRSTSGDRALARSDEEGFVDKVHTMPANRAVKSRVPHPDRRSEGIMCKAARNRPLRPCGKRFGRLIAKRRFRIRRFFGLHRARFSRLAGTHARPAIA
ncbi:MAG: hypothetical protein OXC54_07780 [Rhodospirillaceae bacterium]|nr:hypothetical protein [Rhodospirillaceae bacterium]